MGFLDTPKKKQIPLEESRMKDFLDACCYAYYVQSTSMVSDEAFDKLKMGYEKVTGHEYVAVGSNVDNRFKKETHIHPMLSLEKVTAVSDLVRWANNKSEMVENLVIDWKLDGVSLSLIYAYGHLIKAVTRGNGTVGENVTHNIKNIANIPMYIEALKTCDYVEIRGEVLISKKNFADMQEKHPEFTSARNLASGSVRLKNPDEGKDRNLDFIAYYSYYETGRASNVLDDYDMLPKWGFKIPGYSTIACNASIRAFEAEIHEFEITRSQYPYQTDGLVIKINNVSIANSLGATSHHPKSAIAFKFEAEKEWTTLVGVKWQTSATGRVNPVGILKPVQIGDVTVSNVSLHNLDIMEELNLKLNAQVQIKRANDVIPMVVRCDYSDNNVVDIIIPKTCGACDSPTEIRDKFLYCTNPNCKAVLKEKIIKFANILEVKGIGEAVAENFAATIIQYNKTNTDHYNYYNLIDASPAVWALMANSKVLGDKIYNEVLKARDNFTSVKALTALFIDGVGKTASEKILNKYSYAMLATHSVYDLMSIDGIGETLADNIVNSLSGSYKETYRYFDQYIVDPEPKVLDSNKLNGLSFCVTGTHEIGRTELEKLIKDNGGSLAGVSKNLSYLIAGDKAGSKLEKATKLNIKIINYNEFKELL